MGKRELLLLVVFVVLGVGVYQVSAPAAPADAPGFSLSRLVQMAKAHFHGPQVRRTVTRTATLTVPEGIDTLDLGEIRGAVVRRRHGPARGLGAARGDARGHGRRRRRSAGEGRAARDEERRHDRVPEPAQPRRRAPPPLRGARGDAEAAQAPPGRSWHRGSERHRGPGTGRVSRRTHDRSRVRADHRRHP